MNNTYEKWNDYYKNKITIWSAVCYIISRNGINKLNNYIRYNDIDNNIDNNDIDNNNIDENDKFIIINNKIIDNTEIFLYNNLETYVYKYNFISTNINDSTIHNDHLNYHKRCNDKQFDVILKNKEYL